MSKVLHPRWVWIELKKLDKKVAKWHKRRKKFAKDHGLNRGHRKTRQ